jgi:hypothetical protein
VPLIRSRAASMSSIAIGRTGGIIDLSSHVLQPL